MTTYLNTKVKHIHFIGIGGSGMNGIADILHAQGYPISGSDLVSNKVTKRLEAKGISILLGHHDHSLINHADLVVYSSAIKQNNPELLAATKRGIPLLSRGQMLAALMHQKQGIAVAGTHGKTSTAGLIAEFCLAQQLDPTVVIGGYLNVIKNHAYLGQGDYFVTEADESDASLLYLNPAIAVLTNVDVDHLERYQGNFHQLLQTFGTFLSHVNEKSQSPAWAVVYHDDPVIIQLAAQSQRRIVHYGLEENAMIRAVNIKTCGLGVTFTILRPSFNKGPLVVELNRSGQHTILNTLAAVSVATLLNISDEVIQKVCQTYSGVQRRFEILGEKSIANQEVTVIDDYGHHPKEILVTAQAIRQAWPQRRLVMVFQPHRYTRLSRLFKDFARVLSENVDRLLLLPVYSAGEVEIKGVNSQALKYEIETLGRVHPEIVEKTTLNDRLFQVVQENDILLFQGAGDITQMAHAFMALHSA